MVAFCEKGHFYGCCFVCTCVCVLCGGYFMLLQIFICQAGQKCSIQMWAMHPLWEKQGEKEPMTSSHIQILLSHLRFESRSVWRVVCLPHTSLRATKITVYLHIRLSPPRVYVAGMESHTPLPPWSWTRSQEVNPGVEHGSHEQKWWAERCLTWPTSCF